MFAAGTGWVEKRLRNLEVETTLCGNWPYSVDNDSVSLSVSLPIKLGSTAFDNGISRIEGDEIGISQRIEVNAGVLKIFVSPIDRPTNSPEGGCQRSGFGS